MAARTRKIRHDDETRAKIQAGVIIDRFHKCIMGELELNQRQVSCGNALLNKVLPDLKAVDFDGTIEHEAGNSIAALMEAVNGRTRSK